MESLFFSLNVQVVASISIVALGIVSAVLGTYSSVADIVKEY